MQEIISLNQRVRELGIRDAGAAFADAVLNEFTIEKLSHREGFADGSQIEIDEYQEGTEVKADELKLNIKIAKS